MAEQLLIGVVGSGTMGAGIAHALAEHGYDATCMDTDPALVEKAFAAIRQRMDARVERGKLSRFMRDATWRRLRVAKSIDDLAAADMVIEAVVEDLSAKRKLFSQLDRTCRGDAILASNTSSLSITAIAEAVQRPERVIGMHFFNPAPVMPLVEIIAGAKTGQQAVVSAVSLARGLGKTPVKAKDRPGFIANRVARPFYLESLSLLERGCADITTIDAAVRSGGFPMGPFELLDLIGLDINLAVTRSVHAGFGNAPRFAPNAIQERLVSEQRLGRKTNRGFYDYASTPATPAFEPPLKGVASAALGEKALGAFAKAMEREPDAATWILARILLAVINEGAITAGEGTALPRDIDLSMMLGFNYPEGPMSLADRLGLDLVLDLMKSFDADGSSGRHTPAPLLLSHVAKGELGEKSAAGFLRHSL
ncbi:MAG: 3-hydroxyacyl-CoA dehydrogenase NAD-binding domain-containing protein [Phycisphaerae bacterium]|nr:3-hydroxyacyl-CoA dehydrogenase NAD-binding domain-containing protein [Phycisphaerae bacterium]